MPLVLLVGLDLDLGGDGDQVTPDFRRSSIVFHDLQLSQDPNEIGIP